MKLKKRLFSLCVVTLAMMGLLEPASADFFVRPALRIGAGEIIDGIVVNGPIESSNTQGVVGYSESTVNLADGTVKMYSEEFSPLDGLQTFGSFGETITIKNGAGTNWDVGFELEGSVITYGGGPINPSVTPPRIFYDAGIAVYRPGQADWSNFVSRANDPNDGFDPILFEYFQSIDEIDGEAEFDFYDIFADVFGSVALNTDNEVFDIFVFTNVSIWTDVGNGLEEFEADFLNTGSFDQQFAPGVSAFSSSGQFMGLQAPSPVPVPASLILFGIGLVGLAGVNRRKNTYK